MRPSVCGPIMLTYRAKAREPDGETTRHADIIRRRRPATNAETMRACWNKIWRSSGTSTRWWGSRYSWLSLGVAILGLIASASAWFGISLRENQLAALELASGADGQALNLQVGITGYLRKVSGLRALFESFDDNVS